MNTTGKSLLTAGALLFLVLVFGCPSEMEASMAADFNGGTGDDCCLNYAASICDEDCFFGLYNTCKVCDDHHCAEYHEVYGGDRKFDCVMDGSGCFIRRRYIPQSEQEPDIYCPLPPAVCTKSS